MTQIFDDKRTITNISTLPQMPNDRIHTDRITEMGCKEMKPDIVQNPERNTWK